MLDRYRSALAVFFLSGFTITAALSQHIPQNTSHPLETAQPGAVRLKQFALQDVQGLFGGQSIWAAEDRTTYVQRVGHEQGKPGLRESRYKLTLTADQWAEVERLVGAHNLLNAKMGTRPGVMDEARPAITLVTRAGTTTTIAKWANDKHPDFDPVYEYLLRLCRADGALIREGEYDWKWRPPGFENYR